MFPKGRADDGAESRGRHCLHPAAVAVAAGLLLESAPTYAQLYAGDWQHPTYGECGRIGTVPSSVFLVYTRNPRNPTLTLMRLLP